jgi:galactokinase
MQELDRFFFDTYARRRVGHVRSPLRVCPLGAHVDHQHGLVTGMALDVSVDLAYIPDDSGFVRVQSMDFPDEDYFHVERVPEMLPGFWGNYLRGAVLSLSRSRKLKRGITGAIRGKLPMGGLSSSAAVTTAYLLALCDVNGFACTPEELIRASHWVEVSFIGLNNGILDQSANILSRDGSLMVMDCSSDEWRLVAKGDGMPDFDVLIVNSGFTKALIGTDYNNRVDECKIAASVLEEIAHGKMSSYKDARLRNVSYEEWKAHGNELPGRLARRARHFFTENERVKAGILAWESGDLRAFGELMFQSGESSVRDYECGCPELITIFDSLKTAPGVYGARFSGAGYRGCCIGLSDPSRREEIRRHIEKSYPVAHPEYADKYSIHFCKTADGARLEKACGATEDRA